MLVNWPCFLLTILDKPECSKDDNPNIDYNNNSNNENKVVKSTAGKEEGASCQAALDFDSDEKGFKLVTSKRKKNPAMKKLNQTTVKDAQINGNGKDVSKPKVGNYGNVGQDSENQGKYSQSKYTPSYNGATSKGSFSESAAARR